MRLLRSVAVSAFVLSMALVAACGPASQSQSESDDSTQSTHSLSGTRLRLVAGNITSGNGQDYSAGHGQRIFQGLHPDVVMIQEFGYGADDEPAIRGFVDATFGPEFSYVRGASKQIPNGVISRYPIISGGDWNDTLTTNREFTWAQIDLPGPTDLWVVSVHLLTTGASNRMNEANQLIAYLRANVPDGDFIAIGGDLNVGSRSEGTLSNFSAEVVTSGPWPADLKGNTNTNEARKKPYDWVMVSPGLSALAIPTVIGNNSFANGFVADTRVYSPIADLAPALSSDSDATSMQHQAIVRDFEVPGTATASVRVSSPNGGEVFAAGTTQTIRWSSSNISSVDVSVSLDGTHFSTIASKVAGNSVEWSVPATATTAARVRVTDSNDSTDPAHNDTSDGAFTIDVPVVHSVSVSAPNGGEVFTAGTTQTIEWKATAVSTIDLTFVADGVARIIVQGLDASLGSTTWVVPAVSTATGVIRVSESGNSSVTDVSDAAFSVVLPTALTVTSPNGGETYQAGSTQMIRWVAENLSGTVDVAYAANGTTFTRVATVAASAGAVTWVVPTAVTSAGRIRVSDSATATVADTSDAAFSVTVVVPPTGQVIINEILANEPGSSTAGEFVELFNTGSAAVDLSGWSVSDSVSVRHTFAAGTSIAAGGFLVVFGNTASTGTLGLSNSGDAVKLSNASGTSVDAFTYTSALASVDGVSMNRSPDRTPGAPFVLHTTLGAAQSSPGASP